MVTVSYIQLSVDWCLLSCLLMLPAAGDEIFVTAYGNQSAVLIRISV
jgi:hypothetical protein